MTHGCRLHRQLAIFMGIVIVTLAVGCTTSTFRPALVVPTKSSLPYTAQIRLTDIAAYTVEPGATLRTDPDLHDTVTEADSTPAISGRKWDKSVVDYVTARRTFRKVVADELADVIVAVRIFVFIDPGLEFKFNHTYVAKADALLKDPQNGRTLATYAGFGKAFGDVSRGSGEDDDTPINKSVQAALNDLFGKLETDKRIL
ncbi:MAG: exported protein of unknown function [Nitrospira sp.]|jgi:hypothetical protein|nr:exported protein of unknown function [Nitrospira sp.]